MVIGGDGFMLNSLKKYYKFKKPFYGLNAGSYGFLMNKYSKVKTHKNLRLAKTIRINPLNLESMSKYLCAVSMLINANKRSYSGNFVSKIFSTVNNLLQIVDGSSFFQD